MNFRTKISNPFALPRTFLVTVFLLLAGHFTLNAQVVWHSSITASGDGTSASIGKPSGLALGNLMIVGLMVEKGSGVTVTAPTGWMLILNTNATTNFGMRSYWKITTAADLSATSFSFGFSTSTKYTISNSRFSGHDPAAPINASNGVGSVNNSSGVTTAPAVTTTVANTLIVAFFGIKKNATVNSLDASLTQRHFHSANDVSNLMGTGAQVAIGSSGAKTATFSESEWRAGQQIAIAPTVSCTPPTFTACPSNQVVNTAPGTCAQTVNYTATASAGTVSYQFTGATSGSGSGTGSGSSFNEGITMVTLTADNGCDPDATCSFTITVNDNEDPVPNQANHTSTVECVDDIVLVTPPNASDNCDGSISPVFVSTVYSPNPLECEGSRTDTYSYTDASLNSATWTATYTVIYEDFVMPADDGEVIACASELYTPTPPQVDDNCGNDISPDGPSISEVPACEGDVTYKWIYTDCAGNSHNWIYTFTIEYEDFVMPANDGEVIACASELYTPTPPVVEDNCGNELTPDGPVVSTVPSCEGEVTYTWTYTDCDNNSHDWVYTFTIEYEDFVVPANEGETVACSAELYTPTPPVVEDNCGTELTPDGPVVSTVPSCEGEVTYTWTYTDCAGNSHDWVYTFTIDVVEAAWQNHVTAVGIGSTHAKVNKPAGTTQGDLLVVGLMIEKGTAVTITPPSGWTLIRRTNQSTNVGMATYYKIAGASEPANYTWNLNNSPKWAIGISRITGAHATSPIGAHGGATGGQQSSATAPSITTPGCYNLVLDFFTNKKNATWTRPPGTTERYDHPNNSEGLPSNMMATYVQAAAGATGTKTAVASQPEYWVAQQVSIRPACMNALPRISGVVTNEQNVRNPETANTEINLWPNPTNETVNVDFDWKEIAEVKVSVYNMLGALILDKTYSNGDEIRFDMVHQNPGIYALRLEASGVELVKLFVLNQE